MSDLAQAWSRLTPGQVETGYVRLRLPGITSCAVYAARRAGDGAEALVLEITTDALPATPGYPSSAGFEVSAEPLQPGRAGRTRLVLVLTDERYRDVFRSLCEDIVRTITATSSEADAARAFVSQLVRWQAFLRRHGPGGLSPEERRGLYGELAFLERLLTQGVTATGAVRAWTGCRGANQDFQLPGGSVEVKTTRANTPHSFRVSNIAQLDDRAAGVLFVHLVQVEESENGEQSLSELIESIRQRLDDSALLEFDDSLADAGLPKGQEDAPASPRYTLRARRYFRVGEGFPRLLDSALPPGVEDVGYSVAIAACTPFECEELQMLRQVLPNAFTAVADQA